MTDGSLAFSIVTPLDHLSRKYDCSPFHIFLRYYRLTLGHRIVSYRFSMRASEQAAIRRLRASSEEIHRASDSAVEQRHKIAARMAMYAAERQHVAMRDFSSTIRAIQIAFETCFILRTLCIFESKPSNWIRFFWLVATRSISVQDGSVQRAFCERACTKLTAWCSSQHCQRPCPRPCILRGKESV